LRRHTLKNRRFFETTPLEEALALWREKLEREGLFRPLEAETVPVAESLGRVTAEAVIARISSPFYHSSAMDGYAVRFTDTFGASETSPRRLTLGVDAFYVDTGEPVPEGMNAVIMVEDVHVEGGADGSIEFIAPVTPWQNVRTVGEDIVATEMVAPESHRIRPVDIGAMLASGHTGVRVRRRPRVTVIPTGSEIVEPGTELKAGDIIEFNASVLGGLVMEWGGEFVRHPIVPDEPARLKEALRSALAHSDLVVINAGASAGSEDYTRNIISDAGEVLVHGVNIKPGKPLLLGWAEGTPVLGVPGYPVSAYVTFSLFAKPLLMKWQGLEDEGARHVKATLSRQVASSLGQEEFIRVKIGKVGEKLIASPLGRGAGLIMSLARADGFLRIPAMSEGMGAGAEIRVELLRPAEDIENTLVSIGSHDNALDILANAMKRRYPALSLSSAHVGSLGGLMALKRGEAHLAPSHLLDEETGEYNVPFITRLLPEKPVALVNLVYRDQGLMVLKGNPKGITGFRDLTRDGVTFINRQAGAGTRLLLDKCLKEEGIDPGHISGYEKEEYTHMTVASAVLTGVADAGLGILSAARALVLDFIPVARERYDLVIPKEMMETEMVRALLEIIREDREFREAVLSLGGYDVSDMGKVMWQSGEEITDAG
jgi:putative molybdopterin biosynthesis protein